jgi:hypothetical protein
MMEIVKMISLVDVLDFIGGMAFSFLGLLYFILAWRISEYFLKPFERRTSTLVRSFIWLSFAIIYALSFGAFAVAFRLLLPPSHFPFLVPTQILSLGNLTGIALLFLAVYKSPNIKNRKRKKWRKDGPLEKFGSLYHD